MKQFNRYQRRLTLALLVSALLNLTLLAALSVAFRPVSAEGAAPPVYPKLAVAFLPSATNPVADDAVEAPRKTVQTEAPEERLIESLRDTPPVSDTFAEAATVPPTAGATPADATWERVPRRRAATWRGKQATRQWWKLGKCAWLRSWGASPLKI